MCAPPKIAVFVFVLTIHLAILAFAFPRLALADPVQSTAVTSAKSTSGDEQKGTTEEARADAPQPSNNTPDVRTSPVQHHRIKRQDDHQQAGEKRVGPAAPQDPHQHRLADNPPANTLQPDSTPTSENEPPAVKPDRVASTHLPAQTTPPLPVIKDPVAEPGATSRLDLNPVTLAKTEPAQTPGDAVSIPKPKPVATTVAKPQPKPVVVRRPTTNNNSTKAGSGRLSHLRPLKDADR